MKKVGDMPVTVAEISKVKTLAAMGLSYRAFGRELDRSDHTVKKLLTQAGVAEQVDAKKAELSDMFERIAVRTIEAISEKDIKNASLLQKMTSAAISIDKMRLLRDQSTANIDVSALLEVASIFRDARDTDDARRALPPPQ